MYNNQMPMLQKWKCYILTTLLLFLQVQSNNEHTDRVDCTDQQQPCACDRAANICEFTLEIKQLQTFTSYAKSSSGKLITREKTGNSYYLNQSGFIPSLPPPFDSSVPEYGVCWREIFPDIGSFNDAGCGLPITVDGVTYRSFVAVNGRIPGPTLIVREGQTVVVNVVNHLTSEGVTIHWHGITQQDTPWMDGVAFLSQSPISPGATFRYIFKAIPSGTHWYHSHSGAQRADGLFGALIIREKTETLNSASEVIGLGAFQDNPSVQTMTLLDWQQEPSPELHAKIHSVGFFKNKSVYKTPNQSDSLFLRTKATDGSEVGAVPYWSGLINGRGRYDSNTFSLLSVFNVVLGSVYRFRVIGAQSLYAYKLEVEGHRVIVIATDGYFITPMEVDYIIVHSGERYDFLLNATQPADNYWIRASTLEQNSTQSDTPRHTAEAVLHYEDRNVSQPNPFIKYTNVIKATRDCSTEHPCLAINCPFKEFPSEMHTRCIHLHKLKSLFPNPDDELPNIETSKSCNDCLQFFNFAIDPSTRSQPVNSRTFKPPLTPYQTYPGQYEKDLNNPTLNTCDTCRVENNVTRDCTCTNVVTVMSGHTLEEGRTETVTMVLSALDHFAHPIHLHGHRFFVIHVGHGTYTDGILTRYTQDLVCEVPICLNPMWRNGVPKNLSEYATKGKLRNSAIRKDTVIIPAGGYVVVTFLPNNPGYWFLHCHIEVHLLAGMGVIIQEYSESEHNSPPDEINRVGNFLWTVEDFNLKISKGIADNEELKYNTQQSWEAGFWVCVALVVTLLITNILSCIGCHHSSVLCRVLNPWKTRTQASKKTVNKELLQYSQLESETELESDSNNC